MCMQYCLQSYAGTLFAPSHCSKMRQHSYKAMKPRNAHRITFHSQAFICGPVATSHRESLKRVQQSLRLTVSRGIMDSDPPNTECFPRSVQCGSQQLPTYVFGSGRQRGKEGKTWGYTSKSVQVSRGKKPKRMICPHSFPPPSIRCGVWWKEAELLLETVRVLNRDAETSISVQDKSSCLWGSSAISTLSLGFSRGYSLPVSHSACSSSALLKESWHFQRCRRS